MRLILHIILKKNCVFYILDKNYSTTHFVNLKLHNLKVFFIVIQIGKLKKVYSPSIIEKAKKKVTIIILKLEHFSEKYLLFEVSLISN